MDHRCVQTDTQVGEVEEWATIANTYVQPVLSVFGIIGNLFMLLTIHYGHLNDSPYVYLKCIALGDFILLVVIMGLSVARCATCQFSLDTAYYLKTYDRFVYLVVSNLMIGWLVLLTLFMTMERFIYVRWPMKTQSLCTRERARKLCVVLFFVACSSQLMRAWKYRIEIADEDLPKVGTSIKPTGDFSCVPNINETSHDNRFTCYSEEFPLSVQSNARNPECSGPTEGHWSQSVIQEVPKTSQSLYSLDCLHQFCRLPQIPRNLTFHFDEEIQRSRPMLEGVHLNATIMAVTNESPDIVSENLLGRALLINNTCYFVLAPTGLNLTVQAINDLFLKPYTESVRCVKDVALTHSGWQGKIRDIYLNIWDRIYILCTAVLTVFNLLIVVVVHRANREAHARILSYNKQNTASKRRLEENRLTMSLLALSCVKIFSEIMYITSDEDFAVLLYKEVDPPGFRLKIHQILSNVVVIFEYSSYFYLLAFINRKFKREFLRQVVYGKLLRRKVFGKAFNNLSMSSRAPSVASVKDIPTVDVKSNSDGKPADSEKHTSDIEKDFSDRVL